MKRPSYTTFEELENVFTEPARKETEMKNFVVKEILDLCEKYNVHIYVGYGSGLRVTVFDYGNGERRVTRFFTREELPADDDLYSLYLSIVTKEMILLLKGEGIDTSMLFVEKGCASHES